MPLTIDERLELLKEVGEEIISIDDLEQLFHWKLKHNEEIYVKELGLSRQELINLKQLGVI